MVLLAALVHASWNAVVKSAGDRFLTFTVIHATGTVLGLLAVPLVGFPEPEVWPFLLASMALHNLYYVFLLLSYRTGDLSEVYPIARGSSPLLVALLAAYWAGETLSGPALAGIAVVSLGIFALAFAKGMPTRVSLTPLAFALGTGVLIAAYTVLDGLGMRQGAGLGQAPWVYIVWLNVLEGIPFTLWALTARRRDVPGFLKVHWKPGVAGGCLTLISYAIALYALSQGAMAHVSALRETSVLFAALIGTLVLKESFGPRRVAAAVLIMAGVIALQLSP